MPDENGPLAPEMILPKPPLLPIASPLLRLLLNRDRPRALRSSFALSLAFCSSWRARLSRSASSRRTTFGLNRPTEGPRVARVDAAPRVDALGVLRLADEMSTGTGVPVAEVEVVGVELDSPLVACAREPAAAAPLRVPRAGVLPRTMAALSCACDR